MSCRSAPLYTNPCKPLQAQRPASGHLNPTDIGNISLHMKLGRVTLTSETDKQKRQARQKRVWYLGVEVGGLIGGVGGVGGALAQPGGLPARQQAVQLEVGGQPLPGGLPGLAALGRQGRLIAQRLGVPAGQTDSLMLYSTAGDRSCRERRD